MAVYIGCASPATHPISRRRKGAGRRGRRWMYGRSRSRARYAARDAVGDGVVDLGASVVASAVFESHDADLALGRRCIVGGVKLAL